MSAEIASLEVIDYSESLYSAAGMSVPVRVHGKFVLMNNSGKRYALFAPIHFFEFHANIVEHFTGQNNITGHYNRQRDHFTIENDRWLIGGGGYWEHNRTANTVELWGKSLAYGPVDMRKLVDELMEVQAFNDAWIEMR